MSPVKTFELPDEIRSLDDVKVVRLLHHVGPMLFADPELRGLVASAQAAGPLAELASMPKERRRENLSGTDSAWIARAVLMALAALPRFAPILAAALETLRRDELVAEASLPRGLATDMVRMLAAAPGPGAGSATQLARVALSMQAATEATALPRAAAPPPAAPAPSPPPGPAGPSGGVAGARKKSEKPEGDADHAVVRIYFGTDRDDTGGEPARRFGVKRASVSYGTCEVSIPRDHRLGALESPSIWKLEFRENPQRHVVLLSVDSQPDAEFFAGVRERVDTSEAGNALLFVHGYNVSFADAARRTAQVSYDLGFEGAPVLWSWPSQGTFIGYTVDEAAVEWSTRNLQSFISDLVERGGVRRLYLVAHSMGNRALTRAMMGLLAKQPAHAATVREVILTAPDIDADVFRDEIAPALIEGGRPVTLYASSTDVALEASKKVHGNPRAGDSGDGLVVISGMETIDATAVDTSLIGHGYFAESRSVIADIFTLLGTGLRANERFALQPLDGPAGRYWAFRK